METKVREARAYILDRFKHEQELRSYCQDVTYDGVFRREDVKRFDAETLIDVCEDLRYQFKCEFGWLLS
jgi:hypothetical protein